jgi:hypothetical protein
LIVDDINHHLADAGSIDQAAKPVGLYLAWCVNMGLTSDSLMHEAERMILRVRYRDASGCDLLVSGCGGTLEMHHLNERGRVFTQANYQRFLTTYHDLLGTEAYTGKDPWSAYDRIAPVLTGWLLGRAPKESEPWWKFWK